MNTYNKQPQAIKRRKTVISALTTQLKQGSKRVKNDIVDLSEADRKRINRELDILNERT